MKFSHHPISLSIQNHVTPHLTLILNFTSYCVSQFF